LNPQFKDLRAFLESEQNNRSSVYQKNYASLALLHSSVAGSYRQKSESADEFMSLLERNAASNAAQILYITGYPRPSWIKTAQAKLGLAPEFLRRHLCYGKDEHFRTHALPSESENIITLSLTRIERHGSRAATTQQDIDHLRTCTSYDINQYTHKLRRGIWREYGMSVIRQRHIHDSEYSSTEQEITIRLIRQNAGWLGRSQIEG
jgi:hypothetical protein